MREDVKKKIFPLPPGETRMGCTPDLSDEIMRRPPYFDLNGVPRNLESVR
jgi:hypothetical protein